MASLAWVDPTLHAEVGQIAVKKSSMASREQTRQRISTALVATLVSVCVLVSAAPARGGDLARPAQPNGATPTPVSEPATPSPSTFPSAPTPPSPANPALDLSAPPPEHPSIFGRWWFWTAVGAAAAATVAIIVVSSRGHAPPATDLGNQEFKP